MTNARPYFTLVLNWINTLRLRRLRFYLDRHNLESMFNTWNPRYRSGNSLELVESPNADR